MDRIVTPPCSHAGRTSRLRAWASPLGLPGAPGEDRGPRLTDACSAQQTCSSKRVRPK